LDRDEVVAEAAALRPQVLRAVSDGCLVVDEDARAWLLAEGAQPVALAQQVRAVGWAPERPLLATDSRIIELAPGGQVLREAEGIPGITAVATVGSRLAVGYGDGSIELRGWNGNGRQSLRDTGGKRVTFLAEGDRATVLAGFGDGLFGLWLPANGGRLLSEKLHGPIVEARQLGSVIRVASGLGEIRDVDMGAFDTPYCVLLSELWKSVPVSWGDGVPVVRPPPPIADCQAEAGTSRK
jgi:hypothetical protein